MGIMVSLHSVKYTVRQELLHGRDQYLIQRNLLKIIEVFLTKKTRTLRVFS